MMLIPFEPALPFTVGQIIVWYMLMGFCASLGVWATALCKHPTWTKGIIGGLLGIVFYCVLSWLLQSEASMEFGKILNKIP